MGTSMNPLLNLSSKRAREARLGKTIGNTGYTVLLVAAGAMGAMAVCGLIIGWPFAPSFLGLALCVILPAIWWKQQLSVVPVTSNDINGRMSADVLSRVKSGQELTPRALWEMLQDHWQASFISNHLLIDKAMIGSMLSAQANDTTQTFQIATQIADQNESPTIELGFVAIGLLLSSPQFLQLLQQQKAQPTDLESIAGWLARGVKSMHASKQSYGGVARDWAFGYTPLLNRFGHNVSQAIVQYGARFDSLTESSSVLAIESAFNNHASALVLLGEDGIGKSSSINAFAERLIEGKTVPSLAYHQVVSLSATDITSRARGPGELEQIMISLVNEASHAGNMILFFDDAQLFFSEGPGSFNATQILLSIVQAQAVPMIFATTPSDFQRLRNTNQSLANLLTPVTMQELPQPDVMRILEDNATILESRNHILIAYEALREAYNLSGRYDQDQAYPGRAIKLLEQSVAHANQSVVTAASVQEAVEQSYGVKVSTAAPQEADALLHLEDAIHERMINQTYAVSAVASALRRARAGVTNPRRPIGSFLFLGPTGVGKTELAKAIAATYFGDETTLIRLDMSEYQQPEDVQRLLSTGQQETNSLLMNIRKQPSAVVLLDEIEKAHPNLLNLLLQLLDEGQLTDSAGKPASFKDAVIIATSNAGAQTIRQRIENGESLESFAGTLTDELINGGQFKPELINRFDDIILFRPLNTEELGQVVLLMLNQVNETLASQNISVQLTPAAIQKIVQEGNDPRLGARPMRRALQKAVEDTIAEKILKGEVQPGQQATLDAPDLQL